MTLNNHPFRFKTNKSLQPICAICLGDRDQHKYIQNINTRDLTLEYMEDPQF